MSDPERPVTDVVTLTLTEQAKRVFAAIPVLLAWGFITEREASGMIWGFMDAFGGFREVP